MTPIQPAEFVDALRGHGTVEDPDYTAKCYAGQLRALQHPERTALTADKFSAALDEYAGVDAAKDEIRHLYLEQLDAARRAGDGDE